MKNLIKLTLILITSLFISCNNNDGGFYYCTKSTIHILNKKKYEHPTRGISRTDYLFYLYDGNKAYWCETDKKSYLQYKINDTLPTLVITKIIIKK